MSLSHLSDSHDHLLISNNNNNSNNNNTNANAYRAVVVAEPLRSFDERRTAPSGRRPSGQASVSRPTACQSGQCITRCYVAAWRIFNATAFDCVRGTGAAYFKDVWTIVVDTSSRANLRSTRRGDVRPANQDTAWPTKLACCCSNSLQQFSSPSVLAIR